MGFEIVWTDPAAESLRNILERIRGGNPAAALKFADEIVHRVELAARLPHAGSLFARRRGLEIREVLYGVYRIFYRVRPRLRRIEVLVVWHSARQEPRFKAR